MIARSKARISAFLKPITPVAWAACAFCAATWGLYLAWVAFGGVSNLLYLPGGGACLLLCAGIIRCVHPLEDFWQMRRSRMDTRDPVFARVMICLYVLAVNLLLLALAMAKSPGSSPTAALSSLYGVSGGVQYYASIATNWYDGGRSIIYPPLFPILIRILGIIIRSAPLCAVLTSNLLALLSGLMFHKLAALLLPPERRLGAIFPLYLMPSAVLLFVPLAESTLLFLSLACFYYALKRDGGMTFICGLLAALTSPRGLLLVLPLCMEAFYAFRKDMLAERPTPRPWLAALPSLAPVAGFLIYLLINKLACGSFFAFTAFRREHLVTGALLLTGSGATKYLPVIAAFSAALCLAVYGAKRLRPSLTVYALACLAAAPAGGLEGCLLCAASLFPLAFAAEEFAHARKWRRYALYATFAALQICLMLRFFSGDVAF